jgi:glycosyltransferase involved in cell wall biosynthesis
MIPATPGTKKQMSFGSKLKKVLALKKGINMKKISIVTPCFNEEASIFECIIEVRKIFDNRLSNYELEHIFCDNNSSDKTISILKQEAAKDRRIKIIINSRNFGILKNTYNGVMNASGDAIVLFLPVDLQDPPELIPQFVEQWEKGYEIVYGIRAVREEKFFLRSTRKLYYRLLSRLTYVDYPSDAGDFQLIDRSVCNAMKKIDDAQPFMRLMTFDCGFSSIGIPYTWKRRRHGHSQNRFTHMITQGLNGIVSFSSAPLRLALFCGLFLSTASLLYSFVIGMMLLLDIHTSSHYSLFNTHSLLFFLAGIQLFFIGILGEYIFAIFNQVRKKPLVIERERINFENNSSCR